MSVVEVHAAGKFTALRKRYLVILSTWNRSGRAKQLHNKLLQGSMIGNNTFVKRIVFIMLIIAFNRVEKWNKILGMALTLSVLFVSNYSMVIAMFFRTSTLTGPVA